MHLFLVDIISISLLVNWGRCRWSVKRNVYCQSRSTSERWHIS